MLSLILQRLMKHQAFSARLDLMQVSALLVSNLERHKQADSVSSSSGQIQSSVQTSSFSFKDNAVAMNNLVLSGASLAMSFEGIENAEVSLDRAHVTVEKDTNAVQAAQEKYNAAVAKYGPNSQQAKMLPISSRC